MGKIYDDLTNKAYHENPAIGCSGIKRFMRSPAHFRYFEPKETPAMRLGTAVHTAVLQPDLFRTDYAIAPVVDRRTKAGKEAWAEFEANVEGKDIITQEDKRLIDAMREAVMAHDIARGLIEGATMIEWSLFWDDGGLPCKCRPDAGIEPFGRLADLKTCHDASPDGFAKACANYGYDIQAAWYLRGVNATLGDDIYDSFLFIAVENTPPHAVAVYQTSGHMIHSGEDKIAKVLPQIRQCFAHDEWPGYPSDIMTINLPGWATK